MPWSCGPPRPPSAKRPGWRRPRLPICARRSGPPTTWPSTWPPGSTGRRPTRSCASFAQWQAQRADLLTIQLSHRVAVLEELGYLQGWSLTPAGHRLSRIYHESDLLVAEALAADVFTGADPSVLAGVVSAVVFEPRRARRLAGHGGPGRGAPSGRDPPQGPAGRPSGGEAGGRARVTGAAPRTGGRADPGHRGAAISSPGTRQPSSGLADRSVLVGPGRLVRDRPGRGGP